ncbi:unnamed protein product [Closterium sp. NIES-64]|nr:unnamed protein product [Closterium sp. NIES-64]
MVATSRWGRPCNAAVSRRERHAPPISSARLGSHTQVALRAAQATMGRGVMAARAAVLALVVARCCMPPLARAVPVVDPDMGVVAELAAAWNRTAACKTWVRGRDCDTMPGLRCDAQGHAVAIDVQGVSTIPTCIVQLHHMTSLSITRSDVRVAFPPAILAMPNLKHLNLSTCLMFGPLWQSFDHTNSSALETINLGANGFDGGIPDSLSRITSLRHLDLSYNMLMGSVPTALSALKDLTALAVLTSLRGARRLPCVLAWPWHVCWHGHGTCAGMAMARVLAWPWHVCWHGHGTCAGMAMARVLAWPWHVCWHGHGTCAGMAMARVLAWPWHVCWHGHGTCAGMAMARVLAWPWHVCWHGHGTCAGMAMARVLAWPWHVCWHGHGTCAGMAMARVLAWPWHVCWHGHGTCAGMAMARVLAWPWHVCWHGHGTCAGMAMARVLAWPWHVCWHGHGTCAGMTTGLSTACTYVGSHAVPMAAPPCQHHPSPLPRMPPSRPSMGANFWTQDVPALLGDLSNLEMLNLDYSRIAGSLPSELSRLKKLTEWHMTYSWWAGQLPEWIGSMTSLTVLSLYHSYFNGTIPATIGNLKNLTLLDLSKNKFFGTIPKSLGSLTNLASLGLDDNELSFTIPTSLSRLTRLSALDLSYNRLSGPIPSVLAHLTNLSRLSVKRNRLAGTIPTSLARLTRLASLYNELAGSVPSLRLMNSLWHVGADHNYLTGIAGTSLADIHLLCDKFRLSLGSNCLGSNTVLHSCCHMHPSKPDMSRDWAGAGLRLVGLTLVTCRPVAGWVLAGPPSQVWL